MACRDAAEESRMPLAAASRASARRVPAQPLLRLILVVLLAVLALGACGAGRHADAALLAEARQVHPRFHAASPLQLHAIANLTDPGDVAVGGPVLSAFMKERVVGSDNHRAVQRYLRETIGQALGWDVEEDVFEAETPLGKRTFTNLVFTHRPNALHRIVVAAHVDSKIFPGEAFIGATDSAVPCAMLVDLARAVHRAGADIGSDETPLTTVQLAFFDGEEAFVSWSDTDSIYGARHLVDAWQARATVNALGQSTNYLQTIDVLVLLDLIGHADPVFYDTQFQHTAWFWNELVSAEARLANAGLLSAPHVQAMSQQGRVYFHEGVHLLSHNPIADDHLPFVRAGVPVVHMIPQPFPPVWHTLADNADAVSDPVVRDLNLIVRTAVLEYVGLLPQDLSS